jgi:hypothetical protein
MIASKLLSTRSINLAFVSFSKNVFPVKKFHSCSVFFFALR